MIIKSLRKNCPECPPCITFFEDETPIFQLDLHVGHGEGENCYIVHWRVKKETPFINMQRYEEEVLTSYYTNALQDTSLLGTSHRVEAYYTYKIEGETEYHSKPLNFFLLFGREIASALDISDAAIHALHETFVQSNESSIRFVEHNICGRLEFILQMYSDPRPESGGFKEISFIIENRYFPQKVFVALLQETCAFPISQESAEEILRLAEAEQHAFFNPTA